MASGRGNLFFHPGRQLQQQQQQARGPGSTEETACGAGTSTDTAAPAPAARSVQGGEGVKDGAVPAGVEWDAGASGLTFVGLAVMAGTEEGPAGRACAAAGASAGVGQEVGAAGPGGNGSAVEGGAGASGGAGEGRQVAAVRACAFSMRGVCGLEGQPVFQRVAVAREGARPRRQRLQEALGLQDEDLDDEEEEDEDGGEAVIVAGGGDGCGSCSMACLLNTGALGMCGGGTCAVGGSHLDIWYDGCKPASVCHVDVDARAKFRPMRRCTCRAYKCLLLTSVAPCPCGTSHGAFHLGGTPSAVEEHQGSSGSPAKEAAAKDKGKRRSTGGSANDSDAEEDEDEGGSGAAGRRGRRSRRNSGSRAQGAGATGGGEARAPTLASCLESYVRQTRSLPYVAVWLAGRGDPSLERGLGVEVGLVVGRWGWEVGKDSGCCMMGAACWVHGPILAGALRAASKLCIWPWQHHTTACLTCPSAFQKHGRGPTCGLHHQTVPPLSHLGRRTS